jgi:hypothetical protein
MAEETRVIADLPIQEAHKHNHLPDQRDQKVTLLKEVQKPDLTLLLQVQAQVALAAVAVEVLAAAAVAVAAEVEVINLD